MDLYYRSYGTGPVLIILHGLFGSSDNWTSVAKSLSDNFTVILPDSRNHGKSPHSDKHDYESMANDLRDLADKLGLHKFYLAGHSMGGKVAVEFALKWPDLLSGLLVADISPFRVEDEKRSEYRQHEKILSTILSMDLKSISSRQQASEILIQNGIPESTGGFILKNLHRTSGNQFEWKINAVSLYKNLDNILKGIDRSKVFSLQVTGFPVIFVRGMESDYLPPEDYDDIKKIFPAAEFIEIEGAGHWLHADKPEEVINSIKRLSI